MKTTLAINLDEISDDPRSAIAFLKSHKVRYTEVRSIRKRNILNLNTRQVMALRKQLDASGIRVAAVASPLFKWYLRPPRKQQKHDNFFFSPVLSDQEKRVYIDRAIEYADILGTRLIRIFSNLRQPGVSASAFANDPLVLYALGRAKAANKVLLLENEPVCIVASQTDYLKALRHYAPQGLRAWFDIANCYEIGEPVGQEYLKKVLPYLDYIHVKDAEYRGSYQNRPLGEGRINYRRILPTLKMLGLRSVNLSIETHVKNNKRVATEESLSALRKYLSGKRIHYGIVGTGHIAPKHALAHQVNPNSDLIRVFDTSKKRMREFSNEHDVETALSYQALLNDNRIDVITICTPHDTHIELAEQAIRAGKIVLCEKPLALSTKALQRYLKVPHAATNTYVVFQNHFNDAVQQLFEAFEGKIGSLISFSINLRWWRNDDYFNDWHGQRARAGGIAFNQAIHSLAILDSLTDLRLREVKSITKQIRKRSEIEDILYSVVELKNGVIGSIEFSVYAKQKNLESSLFITGTKGSVKVAGLNLSQLLHLSYEREDTKNPVKVKEVVSHSDYYGKGHIALIRTLSDRLLGKQPPEENYLVQVGKIATLIGFIEKLYESESGNGAKSRSQP